MANKTSHAAVDVYKTLSMPNQTVAGRKVILTDNREVIILPNKSVPVPAEIHVDVSWDCMDDFLKSNENTIHAYHEEFLKCNAPKKQEIQTTGFYVWAWFIKMGKPILAGQDAQGNQERKSTIGSRVYTVLPVPATGHGLKTPQAIACLKIVTESCHPETKTITEADLRRAVETRAQELKTRQDPWRIFQYYRPNLIQGKLLKHD